MSDVQYIDLTVYGSFLTDASALDEFVNSDVGKMQMEIMRQDAALYGDNPSVGELRRELAFQQAGQLNGRYEAEITVEQLEELSGGPLVKEVDNDEWSLVDWVKDNVGGLLGNAADKLDNRACQIDTEANKAQGIETTPASCMKP